MKNLLLALSLLFLFNGAFAQNKEGDVPLKLKFTAPKENEKHYTDLAFYTEDEQGGFIIGRHYLTGYFIEHYNDKLKLVNKYNLEIKKNHLFDEESIKNSYVKDGKLYLIEYL